MDILNKFRTRLESLNPSLYIRLQDEGNLDGYLEHIVATADDEFQALENIPTDHQYDYLANVLEEEFPEVFMKFLSTGILTYELINLTVECAPLFGEVGFPDNEDSRMLRYGIIGTIEEYLKGGPENGI